jgi:hypothetical protein
MIKNMVNLLDPPPHAAGQLDADYPQEGLQPLAKSLVGSGQQVSDRPSSSLLG